jgi:origin recognition complex subunit 3
MCHFYENALSFLAHGRTASTPLKYLQPVHYRAMRTLPSYRQLIQGLVESGELSRAKSLLDEDDAVLLEETRAALASRTGNITQLLRAMHLLSSALTEPAPQIELYMSIFEGKLSESVFVRAALDSIKRMTPEELVRFLQKILEAVQTGSPAMGLDGWADDDPELITAIAGLSKQISELEADASKSGQPARSSYAIHSKGLRTTVIAQRVQLSYENSTLSKRDKEFTALVDRLSELLVNYFTLQNPQDMFLSEVWLYDSVKQQRAVFQPRPRAAIERALSAPYDYMNCECCHPVEGLSSTHPATSILYQMYLETGSLINVFDLWSAFFEMVSGGEEQKMNERDVLVLFYRALADVKSLGMVKQSKKKADHLAKVAWKGL